MLVLFVDSERADVWHVVDIYLTHLATITADSLACNLPIVTWTLSSSREPGLRKKKVVKEERCSTLELASSD